MELFINKICDELSNNNLGEYSTIFLKNKIDEKVIQKLNLQLLKEELGIQPLGDRIKILEILNSFMNKKNKNDQTYKQKYLNQELEFYKLSQSLFDGNINQNISNFLKKHDSNEIKKILSYLDVDNLFEISNESKELKNFMTQGVINTSIQKNEIKMRYSFLKNNLKNNEEFLFDFFENVDKFENFHKNYLLEEELFYEKIPTNMRIPLSTINRETFIEKFNKLTNNQLQNVSWNGFVVAGGIISRILFNDFSHSSKSKYTQSDIDIFLIGEFDDNSVRTKIKEIYDQIQSTNKLVIKTKHTLTICNDFPNLPIQIVLRTCKSITELLCFFDMDCVTCAFNGKTIYVLQRFINSYQTGYNIVDVEKLNDKIYCSRIKKYTNRNFGFIFMKHGTYLIEPEIKNLNENIRLKIHNILKITPEKLDNQTISTFENNFYQSLNLPFEEISIKNNIETIKALEINPFFKIVDINNILVDENLIDINWRENLVIIKDYIKKCYMCKTLFKCDFDKEIKENPRSIYGRLCNNCFEINEQMKKNIFEMNFNGKTAIVTGGRIKIGYETALLLLKLGAQVIITSRFPIDAFKRYQKEKDFDVWKNRLYIFGVDFKNLISVNKFIEDIFSKFESIHILINNAAQTIKREPTYYNSVLKIENSYNDKIDVAFLKKNVSLNLIQTENKLTESKNNNLIKKFDEHGEPLDLRFKTSWISGLSDISDLELAEVMMINSIVPFILINKLTILMENKSNYNYIINVTSPEGQFNTFKNTNHPHTNMAKASLNMMTRTSAQELFNKKILMNNVDSGWITNMLPHKIRENFDIMVKNSSKAPLKPIDGAVRIIHPIWTTQILNNPIYGKFLREFIESDW
ncbi:SDR family NAD(P)-dependent oxidoreductase [uncultured virus]|nr:SDR family NAD(P)-dependent oxidoreductase [uncultured virus]